MNSCSQLVDENRSMKKGAEKICSIMAFCWYVLTMNEGTSIIINLDKRKLRRQPLSSAWMRYRPWDKISSIYLSSQFSFSNDLIIRKPFMIMDEIIVDIWSLFLPIPSIPKYVDSRAYFDSILIRQIYNDSTLWTYGRARTFSHILFVVLIEYDRVAEKGRWR